MIDAKGAPPHVQFSGCAAGGIQLHETAGFEVSSGGGLKTSDWRAATVVSNATAQAPCSVALDPVMSVGASRVRYNWFRSTCFANDTTAQSSARKAVAQAGAPSIQEKRELVM